MKMDSIIIPLKVKKPIKLRSFREALMIFKQSLLDNPVNTVCAYNWDNESNDIECVEDAIKDSMSEIDNQSMKSTFSIDTKHYDWYMEMLAVSLCESDPIPYENDVDKETLLAYTYNHDGFSHDKNIIEMTAVFCIYNESTIVRQIAIKLFAHIPLFRNCGGEAFFGNDYYKHEKSYYERCVTNFNKSVCWMSWHDMKVIHGTNLTLHLSDDKLKEPFWKIYRKIQDDKYLKSLENEVICDGPFSDPEIKFGIFNLSLLHDIDTDADDPNAKLIYEVYKKFESSPWVQRIAFEVRKYGSFVSESLNNDMYLVKFEDRILCACLLISDDEYESDKVKWYWFE